MANVLEALAENDPRSGEFESITLRSSDGSTEAEFVPAANMLCCSLRHRGVEILDAGSGVVSRAAAP